MRIVTWNCNGAFRNKFEKLNRRMICELSNWTGKAYKIQRIKIKDCSDREDLVNTGVYLLFGKDEEGKDPRPCWC